MYLKVNNDDSDFANDELSPKGRDEVHHESIKIWIIKPENNPGPTIIKGIKDNEGEANYDSAKDFEEASSRILDHRKKYAIESNSDGYFTPHQIKYYEQKFKNDHINSQTKVKEWKVLEEIGSGSFGNVFSAFDSGIGRPMAVKQVLLRDQGNKPNSKVEALKLEIDCLSRLNHKNIVAYYGWEKVDDKLNIFLEYVGGGSLESALKEYGGLGEKIIRKYTKQILDGLEYLHFKKIIHRDIKAANILVNKGVCKLTDFGASKKIIGDINAEKFKSFIGTPYWMAPEVITQKGHNRFADIWSLGWTVYEMLTARPPWSDLNEFAAMNAIVTGLKPPKYPDSISPELADFLNCWFKKTPSERLNAYELQQHPFLQDPKAAKKLSTKGSGVDSEIIQREGEILSALVKKPRKVSFEDEADNEQSGQPVAISKPLNLKKSSEKVLDDLSSPELAAVKTPIANIQDEQVKQIYNLVAEKKLRLEDAMRLLPESEVLKIKAITKKIEETKKEKESTKAAKESKRRSMLVQNTQSGKSNYVFINVALLSK